MKKRVLSFLAVAAMVLSMTPVISLPAAAAVKDDIATWTEAFEAAEAAGTISQITTCPFCDGAVTWTELSGTSNSQFGVTTTSNANGHFYLAGSGRTSSTAGNVIDINGVDVCLYLNDKKIEATGKGQIARVRNRTMNIFGDGEVVNSVETSTANMFDFNEGGTLNIYGGTYTQRGTKGMIEEQAKTYATIYGGTFNMNPATYNDDCADVGNVNNVTVAEGMEVTNNGNGTWTVAEPEPVVLPTVCPGCGETVTEWTGISEDYGAIIYIPSSRFKKHCYLANDLTLTDATYEFMRNNGADGCLFLNGKTLTYGGTGCVFNTRSNTLNIYGDGKVVNNGSDCMFKFNGAGRVNILGGEFVQNGDAAIFEDKVVVDGQTTHALISGGTFNKVLSDLPFTNSRVLTVDGTSVIKDGKETVYATAEEAVAAYNGQGYIRMYKNGALNLNGDAYVDNQGNYITVTGSGKLYGMDSTLDDYAGNGGSFLVADTVTVVRDVTNGNRYIALKHGTDPETGYQILKAHRLDMKLSSVTLRAGKTSEGMGLYYKATLSMSEALASNINTYGVVLSLKNMPGADFMTDRNPQGVNENGFTTLQNVLPVNAQNGYTVTINSGSVFGIMKADAALAESNAVRGEMPIYANAYLYIDFNGDDKFDADEFLMSDTDEDTTNDVAWSLFDVMDAIDNRWSDFAAAQEKVTSFYSFWSDYGMNKWTFDNIKKA